MAGALSQGELEQYRSQGFLLRHSVFTAEEVNSLVAAAEALYRVESPARTVENDGVTVRAVHGCHTSSDVFGAIIRDPRMLLPARQVVGSDSVYIHQSKINAKRALQGDVWQWHQDFTFWHWEDGMRAPNAVNLAIFLDPGTEFNGPLLVIPGSHRRGVMDPARLDSEPESAAWKRHLTADLEYTIQAKDLAEISEESGIVSATAPAGSVLMFDPQIVHGSGVNMSPIDRRMAIFSYNEVANLPVPPGDGRPAFLSSREAAPLELAAWAG